MKIQRKKGLAIAAGVLFLLACLGLYTFLYILPGITGALARTTVIAYGNLRVSREEVGYLVREETVIRAAQSGSLSSYVEEGEKTRKGTKVLDIYPATGGVTGYTCPFTGVVSYRIDGLEELLTPERMTMIQPEELEALDADVENIRRNHASAGEPLYKIVTDDVWHVLVPLEGDQVSLYREGATVLLEFDDASIPATVAALVPGDPLWLIVMDVSRYYESYASRRKVALSIVTEDYEGLIIPNTAIGTEGDRVGVYVKDLQGEYRFTPIEVITSDGVDSLVQSEFFTEEDEEGASVRVSTVNLYDEILKRADWEGVH